jgi:hypothetical protein
MLLADKDIPAGYYVNKHGTLRKKNKPARYGTIISLGLQSAITRFTEADLKFST